MTTGNLGLDILIGTNIAALFWNLFFMMCLVIERQERRREHEQHL